MSDKPEICRAEKADLQEIQTLIRATWHATYDPVHGHDKMHELSKVWHNLDRLNQDLARENSRFLIMRQRDQIIATAFVYEKPGKVIIGRVYVHPLRQNSGLGTLLMQDIMQEIKDSSEISLTVEPENIGAIRFYERYGFKIEGPGSCSEDPHDDIPTQIMVRKPHQS